MKECNCIVIDDKKGFSKSALITNFLQDAKTKNHLNINLIQLNPKEERYVDSNGAIILTKVVQELNTSNYLRRDIQLIICDYDLTDDKINGFEIIRTLRKDLNCNKKILLYSSNLHDVVDKIVKGDNDEVVKKVTDLIKSDISDFCKRDDHLVQSIIKHLKQETTFNTDSFFQEQLYKYGDYYFQAPYEKFEKKQLREIADIISQKADLAEDFKREIIAQVIAYMISLENE